MFKRFAVLMTVAVMGTPLLVGTASAPAGAAIKNTLTIDAKDFAFTLDGQLRPGQAQITVKNTGKEPHIIDLVKLKPGVTIKDVKKALNSHSDQDPFAKITNDPDSAYGIPFFLTPGGEATSTTQLVKAGNYVAICFLSTADGTPHFAKGMIQAFKVAGKPVKPQPVKSNGTVVLTDTSITTPPSPAPSNVTVKVENQGTTLHSFSIIKLNGTATLPDVNAFYSNFEGGPLPADVPGEVVSGVGDIQPGKYVYLTWKNLPPGRYGYASISGDADAPGGDDFSKGLYGEFEIQ
jgi:hypothetical protein